MRLCEFGFGQVEKNGLKIGIFHQELPVSVLAFPCSTQSSNSMKALPSGLRRHLMRRRLLLLIHIRMTRTLTLSPGNVAMAREPRQLLVGSSFGLVCCQRTCHLRRKNADIRSIWSTVTGTEGGTTSIWTRWVHLPLVTPALLSCTTLR